MALTWTIDSMTVDKLQDGLTDVVTFVQWRLVGEDGTYVDPEYSGETVPNVASVYGSLRVGEPNPDDFTPYADLTQDAVLAWVKTTFDSEMVPSKNPDDPEEMISKTELYERLVENELEENAHPTTDNPALPWDENDGS
jgi:hypothetical protein